MRVLVVDDDPVVANAVRDTLSARALSVDVARDVRSALDRASYIEYAVIVLDRGLPDESGDVVALAVREQWPRTRILMLTGASTVEDRVEGLEIGADDYLVKPFSLEELVARVLALARSRWKQRGKRLTFSGIELTPADPVITRDGAKVTVSPKEYQILECLMEANGAVVPYDQLTEQAWDDSSRPSKENLKVVVDHLTTKLGQPRAIRSVRGVGYQLSTESRVDGT